MTIISGFAGATYIPIAQDKVIDLAIVGFVFAVLIGGYRVGIPLAIVWSLITCWNLDMVYQQWSLWELIAVREIFGVSLVFFYNLAKRIHYRSPYNVYRAIVASIAIKSIMGLPFDIVAHGTQKGLEIALELGVLEAALCSVFMMLLIKHLRQIHILNGVKKKGEKRNGYQSHVPRRGAS